MKWKDETTYSQSSVGKIEPRTWALKFGPLKLIVTRYVDAEEDEWTAISQPDLFGRVYLGAVSLEAAQAQALKLLDDAISKLYGEVKAGLAQAAEEEVGDEAAKAT